MGDPATADRNGRQLGYAAAAALEALPPPASQFVFSGVVASGANLGTWAYRPLDSIAQARSARLVPHMIQVPLQRKALLTAVDPPGADGGDPLAEAEKARGVPTSRPPSATTRSARCRSGSGASATRCCWPARTAYSSMQVELRRRFARLPLLVLGCTNGGVGYLPPRESYGSGLYQERQSPFAPGCLEQTIAAAERALEQIAAG
ncbi:MAG: hypothetical protein U0Z44_07820 [Kouleothrix sp.]